MFRTPAALGLALSLLAATAFAAPPADQVPPIVYKERTLGKSVV